MKLISNQANRQEKLKLIINEQLDFNSYLMPLNIPKENLEELSHEEFLVVRTPLAPFYTLVIRNLVYPCSGMCITCFLDFACEC